MAAATEEAPRARGGRRRRPGDVNALLRRADWRFLLRCEERPRAVSLASGRLRDASALVSEPASGPADVVVVQRPTRRRLRAALRALAPGGELYCEWRLPCPARVVWARRVLERCGFEDVRLYWPGPWPHRTPQFWLPLECEAAASYLFARRSPGNAMGAALRWLWPAALRSGLVAPVCATARRAAGPARSQPATGAPHDGSAWLLLTGGRRSINKVVAVSFPARRAPGAIVKFARIPQAAQGLAREAQALQALARDHPGLAGAPRVLRTFRRSGELAVVQSAVHGTPLTERLSEQSFGRWSEVITDWLAGVAAGARPQPRSSWWQRLVEAPLEELVHGFSDVLEPAMLERLRARLDGLPDLPVVFEHRDCSPWNVILTSAGDPVLLDWESAEPRGLPALDLVYFLANAAFVVDGALETGLTPQSYRRLLDPRTSSGRVAQQCLERYMSRLGLDGAALPALRVLCWLVHCRSDLRHLEVDDADRGDPSALASALYFGLLRTEVEDGR